MCGSQMGKALALDTPLPTPTGWASMGDIAIGETLFDEQGNPCTVISKSPVMLGRDCYRVNFCDGESIVADGDHRWPIFDRKGRARIVTTKQIAAMNFRKSSPARVALTAPLVMPPADLPVDPYVLGVWLGDGNTQSAIVTCDVRDGVLGQLQAVLGPLTISSRDKRRPHVVQVNLGPSTKDRGRSLVCGRGHRKVLYKGRYQCRACIAMAAWHKRHKLKMPPLPTLSGGGMHATLKGMGLIGNKYIPMSYLRASVSQRWALLQGLMDTDGTAVKKGGFSFTSCDMGLTEDVLHLMNSLGLKAVKRSRKARINGRTVGEAHSLFGTAYRDQPLFRLSRKQSRLKERTDPGLRPTESLRRSIKSVDPVESVPVQCVSVDSPSHLYLAGRGMVPTHNTESLFNVLGHRFTDGPYVPALYIGPTEKNVRSISKDRIDKMLKSTAVLWDRTERGQRYTTYEKWIAGTPLRFGWAGSATELSSHPCGTVLVDERDRMTNDTGDEGDPVELARARTKNYRAAKVGVFSTPTTEGGSPIWALLDEGTRQFWCWHCLACPAVFVPRIDLLKWPEGCTPDEALTAATVVCPSCGHRHTAEDQPTLNAQGRYVRHRKLDDRETNPQAVWGQYIPDTNARPMRTASFWISGLASPWVTFGQVARSLILAYAAGEAERIQAVVNTWGGELYRMRGEAPEWMEVSACRRGYEKGTVPEGVQKITLGADVQKNGIYWVTRGWGFNSESWLLDDGFLAGDTDHEAVWASLRQVITSPLGMGIRIERAFVDSGYRPGDTVRRPDHAVYTFCRSLPGVAFPSKGQDAMDVPFRHSNIDYSMGGVLIKGGVRLYHVNTDLYKRWLHGRIRWPDGQPGGWHLHNEATEDYCKQIVAEQLLLKASGRATWIRKSRKNHFLDCEVLATAAAQSVNVHKLPPYEKRQSPQVTEPQSQVQSRSTRYERRGL